MFSKGLICFLLQCCAILPLVSDESYWDANLVRAYVHHSDMQRRWALSFLAPHLKLLKGDEQILDIGCGDGKITADLSRFIPSGSILGIDPSKPMLDWARKQYHPSEYPNLEFQEGGFVDTNLSGKTFDLIVSNCAFQHCSEQAKGITNVAKLLKPNGKLLILVSARDNAPLNQAVKNVQASPKWAEYWKIIPFRIALNVGWYSQLLETANLSPQRVVRVQKVDPYVDREEFLNFLLGTQVPVIPATMTRNYYNDIIDEYIRISPEALRSDGVIEARFGVIEIEAIKI